MTRLHEILESPLAQSDAFAYVADFSTNAKWDPNTEWARALDPGEPRVGSRYLLGVKLGGRISEMEYRITALEPNKRVVLEGTGSLVHAVDDIRFAATDSGGVKVDYIADINLRGWMRLLSPFAGRALAKIAEGARDGMRSALDELAASRQPVA